MNTQAMDLLNELYEEAHKEKLYVKTVKNEQGEYHKMTGYRMTTENDLINHGYREHYEKTYRTITKTLMPRTFKSEPEIRAYMKHIERLAGRTLEDAEWGILLRTITRGRRYTLTCVVDMTSDLKEIPRYER